MKQINFTEEHLTRLNNLAVYFLFEGTSFQGLVGQPQTVYDLIHNTSINSLNAHKQRLDQFIEKKNNEDEWTLDTDTASEIQRLKEKREFINLLVGYKRYLIQLKNVASEKARLTEQIAALKEENKTPEERLKELQDKLDNL